jgi:hypothetical protein
MKPTRATATTAASTRPSRLLVALAALWMVASIAIGGMATADLRADTTVQRPAAGDTASRP